MTTAMIAPPGLKGLVVADTRVGDVRGTEGFYHYRHYSAVDVAAHESFEAAWRLVLDGELPTDVELAEFRRDVRSRRPLSAALAAVMPQLASATRDPLDVLRAAITILGSQSAMQPTVDSKPAQIRNDTLDIVAVVPTILAAAYRLGNGLDPIEPRADLGHAANYFYMLTGRVLSPAHERALETYLIATIDHGFNASTFTARVITSTGADVAGAVLGAIAALSGPLHGGAPSRALDMIENIGDPANTETWLDGAFARGEKIMGFGHAVYKTEDPRSRLLRGVAESLGGELIERAIAIEPRIVAYLQLAKPDATIQANVEYYAGVVMEQVGLPRAMFTPAFNVSRVVGWSAHILEQAGANKIMRPSARYVGEPVRPLAPAAV